MALVSAGCLDPTQATLEVSTNVDCGTEGAAQGTFFEAGVLAAASASGLPDAPNGTTRACKPGPDGVHDVGSMVVFPEGGAKSATAVVIGSLDSVTAEQCVSFAKGDLDSPVRDRCIVARRAITFADHRPLTIPILLDSQCAGVSCPDSQTCARTAAGAVCVDAAVVCKDETCTVPVGGGGGGGGSPGGPEVIYDGAVSVRTITGLDSPASRLFIAGPDSPEGLHSVHELSPKGQPPQVIVSSAAAPIVGIEARETQVGPRLAIAMATQVAKVDLMTLVVDPLASGAFDAVPNADGSSISYVDGTESVWMWEGAGLPVGEIAPGSMRAVDAANGARVAAGQHTCFYPGMVGCEPSPPQEPFVDVWTGTGDELFAITSQGFVKLSVNGAGTQATARLPVAGGEIDLVKVKGHQIATGPEFAVWVAGSIGNAAYLAHGVRDKQDATKLAFQEIDLAGFAGIVDLWVENRATGRAFAVLTDGRVIAVPPP